MDECVEEESDRTHSLIAIEEYLAYHQQNATPTLQRNESMNVVPTNNVGRPEFVGTYPDSEDNLSDSQTASLFANNMVESNRIGTPMTTPTEHERSGRMPTSISSPTKIYERWIAALQPSTSYSNDSSQHSTSERTFSRCPLRSHVVESHQPTSQLGPQQLTRNFNFLSPGVYLHEQIQNRHHNVMRTEMNSPTQHPYFCESPSPIHSDDSRQHSTSQQEFSRGPLQCHVTKCQRPTLQFVPQHLTRNISIPCPGLYSHRPIQNRQHDVMWTEMNSPTRQQHFRESSSNFSGEFRSDRVNITIPSSSLYSQANSFGTFTSVQNECEPNETSSRRSWFSDVHVGPSSTVNFIDHRDTGGGKRYTCSTCGTQFYLHTNLIKHRKSSHADESSHVNDERPLQCGLCGKTFKKRYSLKRHESSFHTDAKPFQCHFCSKTFKYNSSLWKHEKLGCSSKRQFQCRTCERKFGRECDLSCHELCITCRQYTNQLPNSR